MTKLLTFLNSAELEMLTKISGISRTIAGNIIAARPFDSEEDCLKVHGMGHALLERVRAFTEAQEDASANRALVQVTDDEQSSLDKPQPKEESEQEPHPSFGSRVGAFFLSLFRGLVRLLALVIIIGAIAALVVYGAPAIRSYLIGPVEDNRAAVEKLRGNMEAMETQIASLETQLAEANLRVEKIEAAIATHTATLAKLEEIQTALDKKVKDGDERLAFELKQEIATTRALELLSRARLYLAQSNFGLARADVQSARDLLAQIQIDAPKYKPALMKQLVPRLELALGNLPDFPVVAANDVEIAWQLLMSGQPANIAEATITSTPAPTSTETPTPEPLSSETATATP